MRIMIPVDYNSMEGKVCQSFGRAPYFLIYDTETRDSEFIDNKAANAQGGAGIKAAQTVVDSGVNALITPRCGQNAADVINSANIKTYKTINDSIADNINGFYDNQLDELNEIHSGFHNHGGK